MPLSFTGGVQVPPGGGGIKASFTPTVITDPDFASVVLLIPGEDDLSDASNSAHTVTAFGGAALSSSQAKFGTNSISIPASAGTDIYLEMPDSADFAFGTGDWTMEGWWYFNNVWTEYHSMITKFDGPNGNLEWAWNRNPTPGLQRFVYTDNGTHDPSKDFNGAVTIPVGQWTFLSVVRDVGTIRLYIDGVQDGTHTVVGSSFADTASKLWIGSDSDNSIFGSGPGNANLDGFVEQVRITKGVCRYPDGTTFDVPTSTFPTS